MDDVYQTTAKSYSAKDGDGIINQSPTTRRDITWTLKVYLGNMAPAKSETFLKLGTYKTTTSGQRSRRVKNTTKDMVMKSAN